MKLLRQSGILAALLALTLTQVSDAQQSASLPPVQEIAVPGAALISYQLPRSTDIDMQGTGRAPDAIAFLRVRGRKSHFRITINRRGIHNLPLPSGYGQEFYTYVLWAVSPDGAADNLGEIIFNDGQPQGLEVTTSKQVFWLMVTAEPSFAVYEPSPAVVLATHSQETLKAKSKGQELEGIARYRTRYTDYSTTPATGILSNVPFYLLQGRQSVKLAEKEFHRLGGLLPEQNPARTLLEQAQAYLRQAENLLRQDYPKPNIDFYGRTAAQLAESARALLYGIAQETVLQRLESEVAGLREQVEKQEDTLGVSSEDLTRLRDAVTQLEASLDQERLHTRDLESLMLSLREQLARQDDLLKTSQSQTSQYQATMERVCLVTQAHLAPLGSLRLNDGFYSLTLSADQLFESGKFELKASAHADLGKIALLRSLLFPGAAVRYQGHTDAQGSEGYNQWISEQRALSVYRFFLQEEIAQTTTQTTNVERRQQAKEILGNVDTMLQMTWNAVRQQPRRRQQWLDSLEGVATGKGETEPLVPGKGRNAINRRVTLIFAEEQAGLLASLCTNLIPEAAGDNATEEEVTP